MLNSKLKNGYIAEEKFVVVCMENDLTISRPITNTEPYDFIIETKSGKLVRVQVKKSWEDEKHRQMVCLRSSYPRSKIRNIASKNDRVDYISVLSKDGWYNIPRKELEGISSNICVSKTGSRGKYLNDFSFGDI